MCFMDNSLQDHIILVHYIVNITLSKNLFQCLIFNYSNIIIKLISQIQFLFLQFFDRMISP